MASLPHGALSRIAKEKGLRLADFYAATADAPEAGERDVRPKTMERAKKIAAATDGAVSYIEILEDGAMEATEPAAPPKSTEAA